MNKTYDTLIIGPLSLDIMIDCHDVETRLTGGAVIQSGYAAANTGEREEDFLHVLVQKGQPLIDYLRLSFFYSKP